ncbi:MAG: zinc ribbon domain-containing protein [Haloarculaceae archaeon]
MTAGVHGVGAYAPRLRITDEEFEDAWGSFDGAGITEKAVPEADEDALTMAHEAARRALDAADLAAGDVGFLAFASTTPPLAEEDLSVRLGGMLGVPAGATHHVFTGSTRAGTRALSAALDAGGTGLVVASDCPRGEPDSPEEHAAGAGAAAFVVGPDAPLEVAERAEHATPYPATRFRPTGERDVRGLDVTSYDRQAFRDAVTGAADRLELNLEELDAAAVQSPDGSLPYRVTGALGVSNEQVQAGTTVHELGDTGAASVPLGVASAVADGATDVLAVSFGSGAGADAVRFRGTAPAALALDGETNLSYAEYLRRRGDVVGEKPDGGAAHVSVPTWRRSLPQRHRLVAGRCPECGGLTFPPEGACRHCDALVEFESVRLAGPGEVEAVTRISRGGEPPEFAAQQARSGEYGIALVAFEAGGERVSAPAQVVGGETEVGAAVEPVIRRVYTEESVTRYGFKVQPAE